MSTPLDTGQSFHTGPPVEVPPRVSLGGSYGWPTRETKSRNGVEKWPAGTNGPTPGAGSENGSENDGADTPATTGGKRSSRTRAESRGKAASGAAGDDVAAVSTSADAAGSTTSSGWDLATGWANAMAPPGSAESSELLPERAAGRPPTGATGRAQASGAADQTGDDGAGESAGGPIKKAASGTKAGGRPGPRVAITRTRQTKKKP